MGCACFPSMGPSSRCLTRQAIARPSATAPMTPSRRVPFRRFAWCCWWNVERTLICDAELNACRQGEASSLRLLLERWQMEQSLLLWDSGFHSSWAIFEVCARGGHVLGRLKKNVLLTPFVSLADGSYLTYIYQDQDHHRGEAMLVRVISYTFTDPRIPGAGRRIALRASG